MLSPENADARSVGCVGSPAHRAGAGDSVGRGQRAHLLVRIPIVVRRARFHAAAPAQVSTMRHRGSTPPFLTPAGEILPGSIAEIGYQRLGGLDQWVIIRGASLENPPLILLHGGPGFSEMRLFRHFNAPLENSFTVVKKKSGVAPQRIDFVARYIEVWNRWCIADAGGCCE